MLSSGVTPTMQIGLPKRWLSIDDVLANQHFHDAGASISGREPASSLSPIAVVVVDYFPLNIAGTTAGFVCSGVDE